MTGAERRQVWWRSRRALLAGLATLTIAGGAGAVVWASAHDAAPEASSSTPGTLGVPGTPSATPSLTPAPSPTDQAQPVPTAGADPAATSVPVDTDSYEPVTEPAVAIDKPADFRTGVTARIVKIEAVDGVGQGPGEVSGPALSLTIALVNDTAAAVSLDTMVVELYSGPDAAPGLPLSGSGAALFSGMLGAGESATGVYVFGVPADERGQVQVTVSYTPGAPTVLFEGATPAA